MAQIEPMTEADWPDVESIYRDGIATGNATFATEPPASWQAWCASKLNACSIVARDGERLQGWAAISPTSSRACYAGVVEHSVYTADAARGQGLGSLLMAELIRITEAHGIWMIQSSIFPENSASVRLHERCEFRVVGRRERIARMEIGPWAGQWRDTLLIERRSPLVGI
ncbi:MAG: GNAT family N-acetyltransferase [Roseiflexaceae bacterium]|nr:GNAT family N-acetyltransferase [Roseiflexaceae bacterium]